MRRMRHSLPYPDASGILVLGLLLLATCAARAAADELLVSAASSLAGALETVQNDYQRERPQLTLRYNFAASGSLEQQIRRGAPVDVFICASPREMDDLAKENLIDPATRIDLCGNSLVLIGPTGSPLKRWEELAELRARRIAIGNPSYVPAGRYAQQTLEHQKLWRLVERQAVFAESARQALAYVQGGNAEAGVVFRTDAKGVKGVVIVADAPAGSHDAIVYQAAVLKRAKNPTAAREFVRYLQTPRARPAFHVAGFLPPPEKPPAKPGTVAPPVGTKPPANEPLQPVRP